MSNEVTLLLSHFTGTASRCPSIRDVIPTGIPAGIGIDRAPLMQDKIRAGDINLIRHLIARKGRRQGQYPVVVDCDIGGVQRGRPVAEGQHAVADHKRIEPGRAVGQQDIRVGGGIGAVNNHRLSSGGIG